MREEVRVRAASEADVPPILSFVRELAEYERRSHEVVATEQALQRWLFAERPMAEVLVGEAGGEPAGSLLSSTASRPFSEDPASTWRTGT